MKRGAWNQLAGKKKHHDVERFSEEYQSRLSSGKVLGTTAKRKEKGPDYSSPTFSTLLFRNNLSYHYFSEVKIKQKKHEKKKKKKSTFRLPNKDLCNSHRGNKEDNLVHYSVTYTLYTRYQCCFFFGNIFFFFSPFDLFFFFFLSDFRFCNTQFHLPCSFFHAIGVGEID